MHVFYVRHGDGCKALSPTGLLEMHAAARFFGSLNLNPATTCILSSRMHKAIESAHIIKDVFGLDTIKEQDWLTSKYVSDAASEMKDFIRLNPQLETVIAVSHAAEIEETLNKLGYPYRVDYGSVHEADFEKCRVAKRFVPPID